MIKTLVEAKARRTVVADQVKHVMLVDGDIKPEDFDKVITWNKELDAIAAIISVFNQEEKDRAEEEAGGLPKGREKDADGNVLTFDSAAWMEAHGRGGPEALKGTNFPVDSYGFLFDAPVTRTTWAPESTRFRPVVQQPIRQPSLLDVLPKVNVNQTSAVYMRQAAETNEVATRAENANAAEQEFSAAEISQVIPMVSAFTEVTGEEISDEPTIMSLIQNRLPMLARVAVDNALITGAKGVTGVNELTTVSADIRLTEILDGLTAIGSVVQTDADLAVTSLKTYHAIRKIRDTQGRYYFGMPTADGARSFWGIPVVINNGMANHEILEFSSRAWTAVVP